MTSGGGGSGSAGDPSNQPMDLAQKTVARSLESVSWSCFVGWAGLVL